MRANVTDYLLYRWRYGISYAIIAAILLSILWLGAAGIPGGVRADEISSAVTSGSLTQTNLNTDMIVNLPYHALQKLSLHVFDMTEFAIKLPSIILGTFTLVGIFMLVRTWIKPNIAVITTVILATTAHFLFMAQDGTSAILLIASTIWILVAGMYVTRGKYFHTFWKILAGALLGVILYLPLGVYIAAIIIVTALAHPHIRAIIRKISKKRIWLALLLGLAAISPLIYAIVIDPAIIAVLLGFPDGFSQMLSNVPIVATGLFGFSGSGQALNGLLQPAYGLPIVIIALGGLIRLLITYYTARSYVAILLTLFAVPLSFIDPKNSSLIFLIVVIALATGFDYITNYWYKLFPRNPYARAAGLLPLLVLVGGIMVANFSQYFDGYRYQPETVRAYSKDVSLINKELRVDDAPTTIIANPDEAQLYGLVAHYNESVTYKEAPDGSDTKIIVTRAARENIDQSWQLEKIVTNNRASDSDRFYLYKKSQ